MAHGELQEPPLAGEVGGPLSAEVGEPLGRVPHLWRRARSFVVRSRGRYHQALLLEAGRVDGHARRSGASHVGVVGAARGEAEQLHAA